MTRDQAIAEAKRRQLLHPDSKWVASERDGQWVIVRIGLAPSAVVQTGTATRPKPAAPRDDPYSSLENVTRSYGAIG